jgi:hypothetical protein
MVLAGSARLVATGARCDGKGRDVALQELGTINGYRVLAAIPDSRNGREGYIDAYAIVAVRDSDGEAVSAWATGPDANSWDQGVYFGDGTAGQATENVGRATRHAIERAGYRLAGS